MANEVTYTVSLAYDDGTTSDSWADANKYRDSSAKVIHHAIQSVGTSEEAIEVGDAASNYIVKLKNLDDTNYVQLYNGTGGTAMVRLKAGDIALFRQDSGDTLYGIANTAACKVEIMVIDE